MQGLAHDGVDQPDHRGVVDVADLLEVLLALLGGLEALDVGERAEGLPGGGAAAVVAVDRLLDVGGGGHRRPHRGQLGGQADVVEGEHVGRVGQGDGEHVVGQGHRDRAVADGDVAGEDGQRLVRDGQVAQVEEGQAELVGEGARDRDLVGQAEGGDDLPQPPSTALVLALDAQRLVQLRVGEDLPGDQHLAEPATPTWRAASEPARAHVGGSPLSWIHLVLFYRQVGASR